MQVRCADACTLLEHDAGRALNMQEGGEHINLRVLTQEGITVYFRCKQTTPLKRLMDAFCNRQGLCAKYVRFLYDGNTIHGAQTPAMLGMEDGDVIDSLVEVDGLGMEPDPSTELHERTTELAHALTEMQISDEFAQASRSDAAQVRRLALSPHQRRPACGAG